MEQYDIRPEIIAQSVNQAREEVTVDVAIQRQDNRNSTELVEHLHRTGKLTNSIILRALCKGDVTFFEAGLSKLAGIPLRNVNKLVREGEARGFSALFHAASLPPTMLEATEILTRIVLEESDSGTKDNNVLANHLMERIMEAGYDKQVPNMSYFMALIGNVASEATGKPTHH